MVATLFNVKTNSLIATFVTDDIFKKGESVILDADDNTSDNAFVVYASQPYDVGFGLQQSVLIMFEKDLMGDIHTMTSAYCFN